MEAVRPRHQTPLPVLQDDELPPPPEPFPVELIDRAPTPVLMQDPQQSIVRNLEHLRASCNNVISALQPVASSSTSRLRLTERDQQLTEALEELLEVCQELERPHPVATSSSTSQVFTPSALSDKENSIAALTQQLYDLQNEAQSRPRAPLIQPSRLTAISEVREALAWARVDSLSHAILTILGTRFLPSTANARHADGIGIGAVDENPPGYWPSETDHALPIYRERASLDLAASRDEKLPRADLPNDADSTHGEKMMHDLDMVTGAIERLQQVAPQLTDQRSELRPSSPRRRAEAIARSQRDKMRELEEIWDRIERAHGKRRMGQRADRDLSERRPAAGRERATEKTVGNGESSNLSEQPSTIGKVHDELARARDLRERDLVLHDLMEHERMEKLPEEQDTDSLTVENGNGQDGMSDLVSEGMDSRELITVEDFFRRSSNRTLVLNSRSSPIPSGMDTAQTDTDDRKSTLRRLAGIVQRTGLSIGSNKTSLGKSCSLPTSLVLMIQDLNSISFIAEHQENLRIVTVTLYGPGVSLSSDFTIEASAEEALITSKKDSGALSIILPTAVSAFRAPLVPSDLHLEVKLPALPTPSSSITLSSMVPRALSAPEMRDLRPTYLCCAECDREIVKLSRQITYSDLPSEHWAEMMEVWMCHSDPTWTAKLAQQTKDGFWPTPTQVLVGGSYVLLHEDAIQAQNIHKEDCKGDWAVLSCACGEVLGKQRAQGDKLGARTVKLSKWAIGAALEEPGEEYRLIRYPLSVFVVSDMLELAQAHASYRFAIADEESCDKRLLIWLFTPSTRISYRKGLTSEPSPVHASTRSRRRSASKRHGRSLSAASAETSVSSATKPSTRVLRVAKVLYKVVTGDESSVSSLPGFAPGAQVEQLSYPGDVVARLVETLRESTAVYPIEKRTMAGMDVGFLERV